MKPRACINELPARNLTCLDRIQAGKRPLSCAGVAAGICRTSQFVSITERPSRIPDKAYASEVTGVPVFSEDSCATDLFFAADDCSRRPTTIPQNGVEMTSVPRQPLKSGKQPGRLSPCETTITLV